MTFQRLGAAGFRAAWLWRNRSSFGVSIPAEQSSVFVDVSTIIRHDARTGIQRVVRALWSELNRRSGKGFRVQPVFATSTRGYCCAPDDFLEGVGVAPAAEPVKVRPGDKFIGLDLATHLLPRYRRQLAAWKEHGASIHLVVYDLLPLLRPEWFTSASVSNFRSWYNVLRNQATQAICISDQVARDLRHRLAVDGGSGPKIVRLGIGADIAASLPSMGISAEAAELLGRIQFRPAILMVGTIEPRKGYEAALAAFEWLWAARSSEAPDLVIVGKPGWKTSELQTRLSEHAQLGARLHWLTIVSDEGLCKLYELCAGVLVASYGEGLGLPLLEATKFRKHVLARDLPVFREHRLPNVVFFKNEKPAALGEQLIQLASRGKCGPAPTADLPDWKSCVNHLLREIGLAQQQCQTVPTSLRKAS